MKKLLLTMFAGIASLAVFADNNGFTAGNALYVIGAGVTGSDGTRQSWQTGTNQMTWDASSQTYTWTGQKLEDEFKINDGGWQNDDANFGAYENKTDVTVNSSTGVTVYAAGGSKNITFADGVTSVNNPTVTFNPSTKIVTVYGTTDNKVEISLAGNFNSNNQNDTSYDLTEGDNQVYTGEFTFLSSASLTFQVIVNHANWYGYTNNDGAITFNGSEPVTRNIGTGYQNDFSIANWPGGSISFTVNYLNKTVTLVANTSAKVEYPEKLYLYANHFVDQSDWDLSNGIEAQGDEGVYTFSNVGLEGSDGIAYLAASSAVGSEAGDWTSINSNRYGPSENNEIISPDATGSVTSTDNNSWQIAAGTYNITISLVDNEISVTQVAPPAAPTLYVVGNNVNDVNTFEALTAEPMEYDADKKIYTWTGTKLGSGFKFNNGAWDNGDYNIGAANKDNELMVNQSFEIVANSDSQNILLPENTYIENPSIELDLINNTLLISGTSISTAPFVPVEIILKGSFDEGWTPGITLSLTEDGIYSGSGEITVPDQFEMILYCGGDNVYYGYDEESEIDLVNGSANNIVMSKTGGNWTVENLTSGTEGTLSATVNWNDKTMNLSFTAKEINTEPEPETYTIYAYNATNWTTLSLYIEAVDEDVTLDGQFPGVTMSEGTTVNNVAYLQRVIDAVPGTVVNMTFNDGANVATGVALSNVTLGDTKELYYEVTETMVNVISNPETWKPTDGVSSLVDSLDGSEVIYNLQGQKVANPTKGIFIINGKKVLVK